MKIKILILALAVFLAASLVSALTVNSVSTRPSSINPGQRVTVYIEIENNLNADASNVRLRLELDDTPFSPYQSSSEATFNDIEEDEDKEAVFELIADSDADAGAYKIPIKISYEIEGENKEAEGLISLIISSFPEISVFPEDSILIKGQNSELKIKIVNSGLGSARFLSSEIGSAAGIKILGNKKIYVGDIESDDFDTISFKISVGENIGSIINIPVTIEYRDSDNEKIVDVLNLEVNTYTKRQAQELGLTEKNNLLNIVIGIATIIILYIIYRKVKKWSKNRRKTGVI